MSKTALTIPTPFATPVLIPETIRVRDGLLKRFSELGPITEKNAEEAANLFQEGTNFGTMIEEARVAITAPYLKAQRDIMAIAKDATATINEWTASTKKALADFQIEREREAKRQQEELDRQRRELEAKAEKERKEREEKAEQDRLAAEAEKKRLEEEARKAEEAGDLDKALEAELAAAEAEEKAAEAAQQAAGPTEAEVAAAQLPVIVEPPKQVSGLKVKMVVNYEITDLKKAYLANPHLFEVKERRQQILWTLNQPGFTEDGQLPGIRRFEEPAARRS